MDRFRFERHVQAAALTGPDTAILMMLARRIRRSLGAIPDGDQPSLSELARDTGYHRTTVCRHLRVLAAAGWVHRNVPPKWAQQKLHMTTSYTLLVPAGYPQASSRAHLEQVARAEMADRRERDGIEAPGADPGSAPGPGAGARAAPASSGGAHRSDQDKPGTQDRPASSSAADDDEKLRAELNQIARGELAELTGRQVGLRTAAAAVRLVLEGRDVKNPHAYLRRALRAEPHRFVPRANPPTLAEREQELRRLHQEQENPT